MLFLFVLRVGVVFRFAFACFFVLFRVALFVVCCALVLCSCSSLLVCLVSKKASYPSGPRQRWYTWVNDNRKGAVSESRLTCTTSRWTSSSQHLPIRMSSPCECVSFSESLEGPQHCTFASRACFSWWLTNNSSDQTCLNTYRCRCFTGSC